MQTLLILQFLFFFSFIFHVFFNVGVLNSISDSYYTIQNKFLFLFFCWTLGFSFLYSELGENFIFFISGSFIMLTGVLSEFKSNKQTEVLHNISAGIGIISIFIGQMYYYKLFWPFIATLLFLLFIINTKKRNKVWWIEIVAIFISFLGFLFQFNF